MAAPQAARQAVQEEQTGVGERAAGRRDDVGRAVAGLQDRMLQQAGLAEASPAAPVAASDTLVPEARVVEEVPEAVAPASEPVPPVEDEVTLAPAAPAPQASSQTPAESDADDESQPRRWERGQLLPAFRQAAATVTDAGISIRRIFVGSFQRQLFAVVTEHPEYSQREIADALTEQSGDPVTTTRVSTTLHKMMGRLATTLPANVAEQLPQPEGSVVKSKPDPSLVGQRIQARFEAYNQGLPPEERLTQDQLAEELYVSVSKLRRFFQGHAHPPTTSLLLHLQRFFNVPPDEAAKEKADYATERQDVIDRAVAARRQTIAERRNRHTQQNAS